MRDDLIAVELTKVQRDVAVAVLERAVESDWFYTRATRETAIRAARKLREAGPVREGET